MSSREENMKRALESVVGGRKGSEWQAWFEKQVAAGESKSKCFVEMYKAGVEVNEIARLTDSHYSFVYGRISEKVEEPRKAANTGKDRGALIAKYYAKASGSVSGIVRLIAENEHEYVNASYARVLVKKYEAGLAKQKKAAAK